MALGEFALIEQYFAAQPTYRDDVILGIGDDAAVLRVPPEGQLVVSMDTLIAGKHFFPDLAPAAIAHKALAVNISDCIAMAATPVWFTLSLTMPSADPTWLEQFADGLFTLAKQHHIQLVGGDTCAGPLSITVQIHGVVPKDCFVTRSGAKPGDLIFVTGRLGAAAYACDCCYAGRDYPAAHAAYLQQRLERPQPPVAAVPALRQYASSCIDISDGLAADLQHVLTQSDVGAQIIMQQLPLDPALAELPQARQLHFALHCGDDYELCCTVSPSHEQAFVAALATHDIAVSCIGEITSTSQFVLINENGQRMPLAATGHQHF